MLSAPRTLRVVCRCLLRKHYVWYVVVRSANITCGMSLFAPRTLRSVRRASLLAGLPTSSLLAGLPISSLLAGLPTSSLLAGLPTSSLWAGLPTGPPTSNWKDNR